jgi:hypothetical protein
MIFRKILSLFSSRNKLKEYLQKRDNNVSNDFMSCMNDKNGREIIGLICESFDLKTNIACKLRLSDKIIDLYKVLEYKRYDPDDMELERLHMALVEKGILHKNDEVSDFDIGTIVAKAKGRCPIE